MESGLLLGKEVTYVAEYAPELLFPILRSENRKEIGVRDQLPFKGVDLWNAYELSWLNRKGKPEVAIGSFSIPCSTPYLIESKSLKLYFNSLNQTRFDSMQQVCETITRDLAKASGGQVSFTIESVHGEARLNQPEGVCIDLLDIETDTYDVNPAFLKVGDKVVEESLYSDLLKSNCLVTGQPDWATVQISYKGPQMDHAALLRYIISYRNHQGFHEHCIEQIYMDLMEYCQPEELTVYGRYTRRGGLDINPFRSSYRVKPEEVDRWVRQ